MLNKGSNQCSIYGSVYGKLAVIEMSLRERAGDGKGNRVMCERGRIKDEAFSRWFS